MADSVNHPQHYNAHPSGVECIDIVEWMPFNTGNAIKYLWRKDDKGSELQDVKKALWYVEREIARMDKSGPAQRGYPQHVREAFRRWQEVEPPGLRWEIITHIYTGTRQTLGWAFLRLRAWIKAMEANMEERSGDQPTV